MELPDRATIGQALQWAAEQLASTTDRPHTEAERLLAHVLRIERTTLLAHPEWDLKQAETHDYVNLVSQRATGVPLPYLLEETEFYGLTFSVTPDVLIPRPETERLVELSLAWIRGHRYPRVIDVGTGSGCIAVALAVMVPDLRIYATDISAAALHVARSNARRHNVDAHVTWLQADLLTPLTSPLDLIVSNPPYVSEREWEMLPTSVRKEPGLALLAGTEGLDVIRRLLAQAARRLSATGCLLIEIGEEQGRAVCSLARTAFAGPARGDVEIRLHRDLAGKDRILEVSVAPDTSLSGPANEPPLK